MRNFIQDFPSKVKAEFFAAYHCGKVTIVYDYDEATRTIIKVYRVIY